MPAPTLIEQHGFATLYFRPFLVIDFGASITYEFAYEAGYETGYNDTPVVASYDIINIPGGIQVTATISKPAGLSVIVKKGATVIGFGENLIAATSHVIPVVCRASGEVFIHLEVSRV